MYQEQLWRDRFRTNGRIAEERKHFLSLKQKELMTHHQTQGQACSRRLRAFTAKPCSQAEMFKWATAMLCQDHARSKPATQQQSRSQGASRRPEGSSNAPRKSERSLKKHGQTFKPVCSFVIGRAGPSMKRLGKRKVMGHQPLRP